MAFTTSDPRVSCVAGLGVAGFSIAGYLYVAESEAAAPEVWIFDSTMEPKVVIDRYELFTWTHNWYQDDTWEIQINRYKEGVDQFEEEGFVGVYFSGTWYIGIIDTIVSPLGEGGMGSERWKITGRGVESILGIRNCMHGFSTGDGYDTQTDEAELNMRHYVDANCINPTDTNRIITGLSLETVHTPALGAAHNYPARGQPLPDCLYDHCRATGLSYRLEWTGDGNGVVDRKTFEFVTLQGTDVSAVVKLSVEFGNILTYTYINSVLDKRTLIYVAGEGDGASRTLQEVYSGATEPSGWTRREEFVDARECSTTQELTDKGNQVLAEKSTTESLEFKFDHRSNTYVLGVDFELGDTVSVVAGDAVVVSRIISMTRTYNEGGEKIDIGVGKEMPDLKSIMRESDKKVSAEVRR